ncbi:hypothetical protein GRJ2_001554900 [Grus japonensis]|uniref:Uncharacterized protein n=1 Tax=Grus japonensis TaxID=30415 RepID=A0ABC9X0E5_GRUJA
MKQRSDKGGICFAPVQANLKDMDQRQDSLLGRRKLSRFRQCQTCDHTKLQGNVYPITNQELTIPVTFYGPML